jgi:hypothetical protein
MFSKVSTGPAPLPTAVLVVPLPPATAPVSAAAPAAVLKSSSSSPGCHHDSNESTMKARIEKKILKTKEGIYKIRQRSNLAIVDRLI